MKRVSKTSYQNEKGTEYLEIGKSRTVANISKYNFTATELRELADIANAAAEELDHLAELDMQAEAAAAGADITG